MEKPEGMEPPKGEFGGHSGREQKTLELSKEFAISSNGNYYSNVTVPDTESE